MGGVVALDVEGRVGLGIAQPLRVLQAGVERDALGLHAGQDVVAGAVEDAEDAGDRIAGHRLAHRLDDRNAARHRRLVIEQHAFLLGDLGQRHAVLGKQRLVGGHDMAAGLERRFHRGSRRPLIAADQLDEDVDIGDLRHLHGVVEPLCRAKIDAAVALWIAGRNGGDDDLAPALARQFGRLVAQHARHRRADGPETGDSHTQCFSHVRRRPSKFDRNCVRQVYR